MSLAAKKTRRVMRREAREMATLVDRAWAKALVSQRTGEGFASLRRRMIKAMNEEGERRLRRELPSLDDHHTKWGMS